MTTTGVCCLSWTTSSWQTQLGICGRRRPRLGQDFIRNAKGLLTDDIRRDLTELRDFTFQQHPHILAEQERVDALCKIVQGRIHLILSE